MSSKYDEKPWRKLLDDITLYKRQQEKLIRENQNNMKTAKISKDTAKEMIESGIESLKKVAYDTYPELKENELPEKWEELGSIDGYYIDSVSDICQMHLDFASHGCKNTVPTEELAEAILALCQLLYLREVYRAGWKPDFNTWKNLVYIDSNNWAIGGSLSMHEIFTFQNKETAKLFRNNFRDLLEKIKPLYE